VKDMDSALILADQLLSLIRVAGVSKIEAHAALEIAQATLPTIDDISFRSDSPEPGDDPAA
jgi:hypothetical protein